MPVVRERLSEEDFPGLVEASLEAILDDEDLLDKSDDDAAFEVVEERLEDEDLRSMSSVIPPEDDIFKNLEMMVEVRGCFVVL